MMSPQAITEILTKQFPDAQIDVMDMTGTMDHFEVKMIWGGFQGKGLIEQHRIVHNALEFALEDGRIHALKIKTLMPEKK